MLSRFAQSYLDHAALFSVPKTGQGKGLPTHARLMTLKTIPRRCISTLPTHQNPDYRHFFNRSKQASANFHPQPIVSLWRSLTTFCGMQRNWRLQRTTTLCKSSVIKITPDRHFPHAGNPYIFFSTRKPQQMRVLRPDTVQNRPTRAFIYRGVYFFPPGHRLAAL